MGIAILYTLRDLRKYINEMSLFGGDHSKLHRFHGYFTGRSNQKILGTPVSKFLSRHLSRVLIEKMTNFSSIYLVYSG